MKSLLSQTRSFLTLGALILAIGNGAAQVTGTASKVDAEGFTALFPKDGVPEGWLIRAWNDVKDPPAQPTKWTVENGILQGGEPRGSWLISEKEYSDFILEFEFKLGERGNSGCALRVPLRGDPAFDGAMQKRPIEPDRIDQMISGIVRRLESLGETDIPSKTIGEIVMESLARIDTVGYVRFASVYKNFQAADDFDKFVSELRPSGAADE